MTDLTGYIALLTGARRLNWKGDAELFDPRGGADMKQAHRRVRSRVLLDPVTSRRCLTKVPATPYSRSRPRRDAPGSRASGRPARL